MSVPLICITKCYEIVSWLEFYAFRQLDSVINFKDPKFDLHDVKEMNQPHSYRGFNIDRGGGTLYVIIFSCHCSTLTLSLLPLLLKHLKDKINIIDHIKYYFSMHYHDKVT